MTDVSRSCARCRDLAVVARGPAAYCMKCNETLDWAEVIAAVQSATEPDTAGSIDQAAVAAAIAESDTEEPEPVIEIRREVVAPALSVPGPDAVEPDPFAQRLT